MFGKQRAVYVTFQHQNETCFWRGNDLNVNDQNTFPLLIHPAQNAFANPKKRLLGILYDLTWYYQRGDTSTILGKKHCKYMKQGFIYVSSVAPSVSLLPHNAFILLCLSFFLSLFFSFCKLHYSKWFSHLESMYGVLQWILAQSFSESSQCSKHMEDIDK